MNRVLSFSLQEDFIKNVADFTIKHLLKNDSDLSRTAFVFGGRRPSLFMKKELAGRIKRSYFPPLFFTMDEFIEYTVSKKILFEKISTLDACYIIYTLARKLMPDISKSRDSFSQFLPWSREIFSFIEQLDLEEIEPESLKNIQQSAVIGYDVPETINAMMRNIISLRESYHDILRGQKKCCRGLTYLIASQFIPDVSYDEFDDIIFCNLFYLHKTEEKVIRHLYENNKSLLIFQGDQKDWPVLADIAGKLSCTIQPERAVEHEYSLSVASGFDLHSQVCLVREALKNTENPESSVVVLPDSNAVMPLLSEISPVVDEFNVSMGYPLKRSSLYSLFELISKVHVLRKGESIYSRDYLKVMSHPLIKNLKIHNSPSVTRVLVHKIEEVLLGAIKSEIGGRIFISLEDIEKTSQIYDAAFELIERMDNTVEYSDLKNVIIQLHEILFYPWERANNFIDFADLLSNLIMTLVRKGFLHIYPINITVIQRILKIVEDFKRSSFRSETFTLEEMFDVFVNIIEKEVSSFHGSPLKGLQILGMLETRSLSFENVIIMDVNEAALPKLQIYEPLIPREVMLQLGLNRLEKEDEIQRYQFMRLISSAKNVHLIYQDSKDKERSRFIEELIWNRQKKERSLDVMGVERAGFNVGLMPVKTHIKKSKMIMPLLKDLTYSASSVNTYLKCPLRFYYHYVLGLREKEDLLEDIEGSDIGIFIHEFLETAYRRFRGKCLHIDEPFKKYFFELLEKQFKEFFTNRMRADSFLLEEILKVRMERFLEYESNRDVTNISAIEEKFDDTISFEKGDYAFTARIDRIDELPDGTQCVIDYKTGSVDQKPAGIKKLSAMEMSRDSINRIVKSFQLPLYVYLAGRKYPQVTFNAGLYYIKTPELVEFPKPKEVETSGEIINICMKALGFILDEINNPDISFKPDESDDRYCNNCPFFYLCR